MNFIRQQDALSLQHTSANANRFTKTSINSDPRFKSAFRDYPDTDLGVRWIAHKVVNSFPCRHESFRQVS